jgi:hypothetical protein
LNLRKDLLQLPRRRRTITAMELAIKIQRTKKMRTQLRIAIIGVLIMMTITTGMNKNANTIANPYYANIYIGGFWSNLVIGQC